MDIGDVEANLIGFIYCQDERRNTSKNTTVLDLDSITETGPDEGNFRNQVMAQREKNKVQTGVKSLENVMREVSVSDMQSLFQFEKVSDS
jgi:hypothetical protein